MDRSIGGKSSGELSGLTIMVVVVAVAIGAPVYAVDDFTEVAISLLNLDGTNIDTGLLLAVCYTNGDGNPECEYSDNFPANWFWSTSIPIPALDGKSSFYGGIRDLRSGNITLTVDGYEPLEITAIENGQVLGTYYVAQVPSGADRTQEFNDTMAAAIANNGGAPAPIWRAANLKTELYDGTFNTDDPLIVDVRSYAEYATGHINYTGDGVGPAGAINIYYRDLGKTEALGYLDSALQNHTDAGGKDEIVVYHNTRHISRMVAYYLSKTQGYNVRLLRFGMSEWTDNLTVAPGRYIKCTTFNQTTGKGLSPANCNSNNFTVTLADPVNVSDGTHGGQGWPELNTGGANVTEIIRLSYDARFGNMSKPEYEITATELYDLLDDNQDGQIQGSGDDLTNDPYVLSNRGTRWVNGCPTGPYYTKGHIPNGTAVDWCWETGSPDERQELRALDNSDFLPTNRTIVHHCWVGVSQQYGGVYYTALGYEVRSLDWGVHGWNSVDPWNDSTSVTVNPLNYPFDSLPPDTTPPANVTTTVEQRMDYKSNVTWTPVTDSESGIREYNIYQRVNDDPVTDTLIVTVFAGYGTSPSQPYVAGPGYDDGNFYQYMVTAVDNAGNEGGGAYEPVSTPPPPLDMTPPPNVTTTVVQRLDYNFNITWTPVEDDDSGLWGYRIYQRLNDDPGTDALIASVFAGYNSSPSQPYVAGPGYDDGNLYQYNVTAVDNSGNEGGGAYAPPEGPVPPIPFAPLGTLLTLSSGLVAYGYYRRKTH